MKKLLFLSAFSFALWGCAPHPKLEVTSTKQFSDGSYLIGVETSDYSRSFETNLEANRRARAKAVSQICPMGGSAVRVDREGIPGKADTEEKVTALITLMSQCEECRRGLSTTTYYKVKCNEN